MIDDRLPRCVRFRIRSGWESVRVFALLESVGFEMLKVSGSFGQFGRRADSAKEVKVGAAGYGARLAV